MAQELIMLVAGFLLLPNNFKTRGPVHELVHQWGPSAVLAGLGQNQLFDISRGCTIGPGEGHDERLASWGGTT